MAWFWHSGRVIMCQDDSCRIVLQCTFYYFPWMNTGTIDGAGEHLIKADNPVAVVQKQDCEDLMLKLGYHMRTLGIT